MFGAFAPCCLQANITKSISKHRPRAESLSLKARWRVDHYVYDAATRRNWAILLDCEHPDEPSRMVLIPGSAKGPRLRTTAAGRAGFLPQRGADFNAQSKTGSASQADVRTGEAVIVSSRPAFSAVFALPGTAEDTASAGRLVRVRLQVNGAIVRALVLGPHRVELVPDSKPQWRQ